MLDVLLIALRLVLIVALVALLVALLAVLWQELRVDGRRHPPQAWLVLLNEDGSERRRYALPSLAWIGRDPACWVRVDDEFTSARHALVFWDGVQGMWWIEDNHSRNGTQVNGLPIARAPLRPGDAIQVGSARLRFAPADVPLGLSLAPLLQAHERVSQHGEQQPADQHEQTSICQVRAGQRVQP